jgi:hypothetical protein
MRFRSWQLVSHDSGDARQLEYTIWLELPGWWWKKDEFPQKGKKGVKNE